MHKTVTVTRNTSFHICNEVQLWSLYISRYDEFKHCWKRKLDNSVFKVFAENCSAIQRITYASIVEPSSAPNDQTSTGYDDDSRIDHGRLVRPTGTVALSPGQLFFRCRVDYRDPVTRTVFFCLRCGNKRRSFARSFAAVTISSNILARGFANDVLQASAAVFADEKSTSSANFTERPQWPTLTDKTKKLKKILTFRQHQRP